LQGGEGERGLGLEPVGPQQPHVGGRGRLQQRGLPDARLAADRDRPAAAGARGTHELDEPSQLVVPAEHRVDVCSLGSDRPLPCFLQASLRRRQ